MTESAPVPKPSAGGTGLGLAITRGLLRAGRGCIEAQNDAGGGAAFLLRLAEKAAEAQALA